MFPECAVIFSVKIPEVPFNLHTRQHQLCLRSVCELPTQRLYFDKSRCVSFPHIGEKLRPPYSRPIHNGGYRENSRAAKESRSLFLLPDSITHYRYILSRYIE